MYIHSRHNVLSKISVIDQNDYKAYKETWKCDTHSTNKQTYK